MKANILILIVIVIIIIGGIVIIFNQKSTRPGQPTITFIFDPVPTCEDGHIKGYVKSTTFSVPISRDSFFILEVDGKDISQLMTLREEIEYDERGLLFDYNCDAYCSGNHTITAATYGSIYTVDVECL